MDNLVKITGSGLVAAEEPWAAARLAWLDAKQNRTGSAHTRRAYDKGLADWLDYLDDIDRHVSEAGGVEVNAWRQQLTANGSAAATVAARLAAVSSFYRYCQHKFTLRHGGREVTLIDYNPVDRAERPRVDPYAGAQKIRPDELPALLAAPDRGTIQGKRDYSLLLAFVFTGRRLVELARLTWSDLDQAGEQVSYTYTGKGSKRNTRQLPPPVWQAITDYLHASGRLGSMSATSPLWIAHSDAGAYLPNVVPSAEQAPLSVAMVRRLVNRYTRKALGRAVSPHALRHAAAMLREDIGDDPRAIQQLLDHSSLDMTSRYMSAMRIDRDESWQAVAQRLGV
jgi:integrase